MPRFVLRRPIDIVVVGAGVVGLTSAICLQRRGLRVLVLTADAIEETTSSVAAAVWFPTRVGPRERVVDWGARTYASLTELADDTGSGVLLRRTRMLYRRPPGEPWWCAAVPNVTVLPSEELPAGYGDGLEFIAPLAEMNLHLPWLAARFKAAGGEIRRERLGSLLDAKRYANVVVNCTGLGARTLVPDETVVPVRGQIIRTSNPGLEVSFRDEDHPEGYTYVHPRSADCILGGTMDEGDFGITPDPRVAEQILRRCRAMVPELTDARVLEHRVGLRPARPVVRLELEELAPGFTAIHNYGHGGAGVTLGWGAAEDVAALAVSALDAGLG